MCKKKIKLVKKVPNFKDSPVSRVSCSPPQSPTSMSIQSTSTPESCQSPAYNDPAASSAAAIPDPPSARPYSVSSSSPSAPSSLPPKCPPPFPQPPAPKPAPAAITSAPSHYLTPPNAPYTTPTPSPAPCVSPFPPTSASYNAPESSTYPLTPSLSSPPSWWTGLAFKEEDRDYLFQDEEEDSIAEDGDSGTSNFVDNEEEAIEVAPQTNSASTGRGPKQTKIQDCPPLKLQDCKCDKHYMKVGEMFVCGDCETKVTSRQRIRMHLVKHHEDEVNVSESDIIAHCTSTSVATNKEPPHIEPELSNERPKR